MPDIDTIRKQLADTALYHGMSYAAIVGVASEIEAVEDKHERAALRREFRELHGLTAQVWARVEKRMPGYKHEVAQVIRAQAYCCQLSESEGNELFVAHLDHLLEPGALGLILRDVNDALDARRNGNGEKKQTLAEQCADLSIRWADYAKTINRTAPIGWYDAHGTNAKELAALPAVASVLAKRGKAEK